MIGRVLVVGGSDSGGGAGVQADIKTVTALGGYALSTITALTAQDSQTVHDIFPISDSFIALQLKVALADPGADVIKTGMLGSHETITTVAHIVNESCPMTKLIIDPVMVAKGGSRLLAPEAETSLVENLLPHAYLVTPNLPEAAALLGRDQQAVTTERERAAQDILALGPQAVLLKGGHSQDHYISDLLAQRDRKGVVTLKAFQAPRILSRSTHGTGCTLASAIATSLAQGLTLPEAVIRARDYVRRAISTAPNFGYGYGPLNHAHPLEIHHE